MRIVTAEEAVAGIRSGDQVYVQCAAATPEVLLARHGRARAGARVTCASSISTRRGPGRTSRPRWPATSVTGRCSSAPTRAAPSTRAGPTSCPCSCPTCPRCSRAAPCRSTRCSINVTPPDAHGFCSLGTSVEATHAAIGAATTVIAQLNRAMPRTLGESFIHVSQIDLGVEVDEPVHEVPRPVIGDVERRIGALIADLVVDGATLQLGIGAIPAATAAFLDGKRDLGIHTEMFTDAVVDLVEAGVVTGAAKARNRGKIVTAFMMGTRALYDFVDDNPMVEMRPVDFTNDTHVIRSFANFTAINSAIEVDLTGQVVADSIGHRLYSGVGGQMDFIRGAALAEGGRPIIALPSTAGADGSISRKRSRSTSPARWSRTRSAIGGTPASAGRWTSSAAPRWPRGAADHRAAVDGRRDGSVSRINAGAARGGRGRHHARPRADGRDRVRVAELWGRSLRERAAALIAVAHPDHRDRLAHEARLHYDL